MSEIEVQIDNAEGNNVENNAEEIDNAEGNNEHQSNEIKQIEYKQIKKLTSEEKDIIVNNARNNIENDYYDVMFYKNGNYRILLKKNPNISLSQKHINNNENNTKSIDNTESIENGKNQYLTDNQFLMKHILKLNSKVEHLRNKQKKLKRKYKKMKFDIYEDVDNTESNTEIIDNPIGLGSIEHNTESNSEVGNNENISSENIPNERIYIKPRGWRQYI